MNSGNPVPGASAHDGDAPEDADREAGQAAGQQVRDIQQIIAELERITKRLAHPLRTLPQPRGPQPPGRS